MVSAVLSILALLPLIGQTFNTPSPALQPDLNPIPSLPGNFSKKPEHWNHATSLLQSPGIPGFPTFVSKRANNYWTGWEHVSYLFSFGNSYTSTNFTINGEQPNPSNPLGNPVYPGATSSAGPNYIDFITSTYNQSFIQTYNFGYGGAVINNSVIPESFGPLVQNFEDQVQGEFLPTYVNNREVEWTSSNSLFSIFFGVNDVTNSWAEDNDTLGYEVIQSYQNLVNELYTAGARNFLFLNVPPIDRSPGTIEQGPAAQAAEAANIGRFNFRLGALVYNLSLRHPDTTTFLFDTNFLYTRVLDNPGQFMETADLRNTTNYCALYADEASSENTSGSSLQAQLTNSNSASIMTLSDPTCGVPLAEYFWLNTLHPTFTVHNFMGSQIALLLQSQG